jgi:hypothetical protein
MENVTQLAPAVGVEEVERRGGGREMEGIVSTEKLHS